MISDLLIHHCGQVYDFIKSHHTSYIVHPTSYILHFHHSVRNALTGFANAAFIA